MNDDEHRLQTRYRAGRVDGRCSCRAWAQVVEHHWPNEPAGKRWAYDRVKALFQGHLADAEASEEVTT